MIFRLVYNEAECKKPIERLWISSLEDSAIKSGFASLHKGSDFDNLYSSALCRERADWLIGMNLSRLFSTKNNKVFSIGRVQTPTLAMICARDAEIKNFKKGYFYTVDLDCKTFVAKSDKIDSKETAEKISAGCDAAKVISVKRENKATNPPKLYDLTTLQREANDNDEAKNAIEDKANKYYNSYKTAALDNPAVVKKGTEGIVIKNYAAFLDEE